MQSVLCFRHKKFWYVIQHVGLPNAHYFISVTVWRRYISTDLLGPQRWCRRVFLYVVESWTSASDRALSQHRRPTDTAAAAAELPRAGATGASTVIWVVRLCPRTWRCRQRVCPVCQRWRTQRQPSSQRSTLQYRLSHLRSCLHFLWYVNPIRVNTYLKPHSWHRYVLKLHR